MFFYFRYISLLRGAFILFFPLLLCLSCQQSGEQNTVTNVAVENYIVEQASYFRFINDEKGVYKVELRHPDTGETYSFYPLDTNKRCIALSSTLIGMLAELGLDSLIVGVSGIQYVDNLQIHKNYEENKVIIAGYETQLNIESIVSRNPSVLFHNGFTAQLSHQQQLESLGVQCIPIYDWKEQTPLGKAEWIKVYGFLFGRYAESTNIFSEISKKYLKIKESVSHLSPSKPVLCGNIMGGEWYCPAGNSFFAQLLRDANISYKYSDTQGTGSIALTQEQILKENKSATYWINAGATSLNELKIDNPKSVFFEAFKQKQVYCYYKRGNFYWEKSSIRPDELLSDLVTIAHPEFSKNKKLFFYERLL